MTTAVRLSDDIVCDAKRYAGINCRSVPKQIEYWFKIGKIAEENPDLPFSLVKEILLARDEADAGETTDYKFG
jgi:hypothetical protein